MVVIKTTGRAVDTDTRVAAVAVLTWCAERMDGRAGRRVACVGVPLSIACTLCFAAALVLTPDKNGDWGNMSMSGHQQRSRDVKACKTQQAEGRELAAHRRQSNQWQSS